MNAISFVCFFSSTGDLKLLKEYEKERQVANLVVLGSLDVLSRLYGTETNVIKWLRNVGLGAINGMEPVKKQIIKQAVGI